MRKIDKEEWKKLMNQAIHDKKMNDIAFLWSKFEEIEQNGYFALPF